jgi:hypothetical protein
LRRFSRHTLLPQVLLWTLFLGGCVSIEEPFSGFKPIDPPLVSKGGWKWAAVDSLQPVLKWGPFPGEHHEMEIQWNHMQKAKKLEGKKRQALENKTLRRYEAGSRGFTFAVYDWIVTPFLHADPNKVTNVTFDVRIWEVAKPNTFIDAKKPKDRAAWKARLRNWCADSKRLYTPYSTADVGGREFTCLVYDKMGVRGESHKVTQKLKPGTRYYWTVRARFLFDGMSRRSEWSMRMEYSHDGQNIPGCALSLPASGSGCSPRYLARLRGAIPPYRYYRFQTPK